MTEAKVARSHVGIADAGAVRWWMLLTVLTMQITLQASLQSPSPLAPFLQAELHISRAQVGLLGSAVAFGSILTVLPIGLLADRFGAHLLLFAGPATIGTFLFLASRASSFWLMAASLAVVGIGIAMGTTAASKAVMSWFTARTRGTAMGIKQTGTSVGYAVVAAVLPGIALAIDWRFALAVTAASVIAAGLLCLVGYRDPARAVEAARPPSIGSLRAVLGNRNVQLGSLGNVCLTGVQMTVSTYLMLYFIEVRGMEVTAAGALLALAQLGGVSGRILFGLASDRLFGARRKGLLVFTGTASAVTGLLLAAVGAVLPFEALVVVVLFFGLVSLGWTGLFSILMVELSGRQAAGQGAAAGLLGGNIGYFAIPPLFGLIVDLSHSYQLALICGAIVSAIGVAAMSAVRERPGE